MTYYFCRIIGILAVLTVGWVAFGCKPSPSPSTSAPVESQKSSVADEGEPSMPYRHFPSAAEALTYIIQKSSPSMIGFGEFHQQQNTIQVRSALARFTNELLPLLKDRVSDLVVETWVSTGACGKHEEALTQEVSEVTKRPEATEDETVTLIKRAAKLEIKPRVLKLDCSDYERLQVDGGVDYLGLLTLIGQQLEKSAKQALADRIERGIHAKSKGIAVFGGAIHNDAKPEEMWADVSYGVGLKAISPRYVEIDLYVPEFVKNSRIAQRESWFPTFQKQVSSDQVTLIEQGERSFVIVFKKGVSSAKSKQ